VISRAKALQITSRNFPSGPEHLAKYLGITVVSSTLVGVEGWCVRGTNTVIRINSLSSTFRQRFTLSHELAHLILGTEPDIAIEPFRSSRREERDADQLASELLIPSDELDRYLRGHLPIDARTLERLARAANVSPVMAACRVVSATSELGLENAAVVFFMRGKEQWRYSHGLQFDPNEAEFLLREAAAVAPKPVRRKNSPGELVVGSIIEAQVYQVLLVQLLPEKTATQETREEQLSALAGKIFGSDHNFRQSVAACLGIVKHKCQGKSLDEAILFFGNNYLGKKYTGIKAAKLRDPDGRSYVKLYLERWFT
jgi:hypothetical protein